MALAESSRIATDREIPGIGAIVREWVALHIDVPGIKKGADFGDGFALAVVRNGHMVAGVVYNCWDQECRTIQASVCAGTRMWATKPLVLGLLSFAFDGLDVNRIWARVPSDNERALRFDKRICFVQEGVAADDFGPGRNAVGLRMLRKEYDALRRRWGYEQKGRKLPKRKSGSFSTDIGEHGSGALTRCA